MKTIKTPQPTKPPFQWAFIRTLNIRFNSILGSGVLAKSSFFYWANNHKKIKIGLITPHISLVGKMRKQKLQLLCGIQLFKYGFDTLEIVSEQIINRSFAGLIFDIFRRIPTLCSD